ncbi:putative toxin-antitoxin system toxin component, PIN family [Candidatus Gottesmanbacteria bacterium]|nr:putative toxin-antitoxin system toxin component, PIN family [Candidatus Gottesmanbacteria bacterium]
MRKKPKVVIDTNVLVSASFRKISPIPSKIYQTLKSQKFILVTSLEILEEVEDVINRDYIIIRSRTTEKDRRIFIKTLKEISMITPNIITIQNISRDLKDDKFLVCAYEAKADYIVTGNKDLLSLKKYEDTKIVTPRKFIKLLYRRFPVPGIKT